MAAAEAGSVPDGEEEPGPVDAGDTLSGLGAVEPGEVEAEVQEEVPVADEQPTEVIREGDVDPLAAEPQSEDPEVVEPEVEPSTAQGEWEEPSLAEESSSQEFFHSEQDEPSDSRVFRTSRFLRRRE